jgi:glycosyltransferase involved in cell wall biosynthesis/thymidylate kinase
MTRIVTVVGIDGSGKSTLSDRLVDCLITRGHRTERVWLGAESKLMSGPRAFLKFFWKARGSKPAAIKGVTATSSENGYQAEIARKNHLAGRFRTAARIYVALALADYQMQISAKLWRHRRLDLIVADRYLFDVVVNIGLTLGWTPEKVVSLAQRQLGRFPTPHVMIFLRVQPEVSLSRKNDIPDIDYLRLRLRYYEAIATAFGFNVLDGMLPPETNADLLLDFVLGELEKPLIHYVHSNNSDVGGADRVLALMVEHARTPAGSELPAHRVSVSLREDTAAVDAYTRLGVPVLLHHFVRPQVSGRAISVVMTIVRAPGTLWYFWRLWGRNRPDIVHVNDLYDFLPALAAHVRRIPVVYHLRMIKTNPRLRRGFSALVPAISKASISVSRAVHDHYFPTIPTAHRAEVIHDLGNSALMVLKGDVIEPGRRPDPLPDWGRLVLMVGRMEAWKGQDVFLDAVSRLPVENTSRNVFALVGGAVPGSAGFLGHISRKADQLGVLYLGERDDIPALLRATDISVHCSTAPDPFPGVVVESLLAGAATIAADAGGVPEMIRDQESGILTEPGDSAALAAALEELLNSDESPRIRYGPAGRASALRLVDPFVVDRQIADLYRALAPISGQALPRPRVVEERVSR